MTQKFVKNVVSILLFSATLVAHANSSDPAAYDKIYPLYAIGCSGTGARKLDDPKNALNLGHALIYLKGVCRDTSVNYPKIRKCFPGEKDLTSSDSGTTLSLDDDFINTRYIAIDGFDMTLNGGVSEQDPLDTSHVNAAVGAILKSGAGRGIRLNASKESQKPTTMSEEEWVVRESLSTSYAIRFGRNNRCVSVPINEAMLDSAVAWVNDQNEPFVSGKVQFKWNLTNTCAHFTHDVLASMGIGDFVKPATTTWSEVFAISSLLWKPWHPAVEVPMNEVLSTEERAGSAKIPNAEDLFSNEKDRIGFDRFGRLPSADGVLIWAADIHQFDNQLFHTVETPVLLDIPLFHPRRNKLASDLNTPSKTKLSANINAYRERLEKVIQGQASFEELTAKEPGLNTAAFKSFYERYTAFLKQEDEILSQKLSLL